MVDASAAAAAAIQANLTYRAVNDPGSLTAAEQQSLSGKVYNYATGSYISAAQDAANEAAKQQAAFSQPRSDVVTQHSAEYNAIVAKYEQQHYANVGSSGVTYSPQYRSTENIVYDTSNAAGIAAMLAGSGGATTEALRNRAISEGYTGPFYAQSSQGGVANVMLTPTTPQSAVNMESYIGRNVTPLRDYSSSVPTGYTQLSGGDQTRYTLTGPAGIGTIKNLTFGFNPLTGEAEGYQTDKYGNRAVVGIGRYGMQSGEFTLTSEKTGQTINLETLSPFWTENLSKAEAPGAKIPYTVSRTSPGLFTFDSSGVLKEYSFPSEKATVVTPTTTQVKGVGSEIIPTGSVVGEEISPGVFTTGVISPIGAATKEGMPTSALGGVGEWLSGLTTKAQPSPDQGSLLANALTGKTTSADYAFNVKMEAAGSAVTGFMDTMLGTATFGFVKPTESNVIVQPPVVVSGKEVAPEKTYQYGEWSKLSEGSGKYVQGIIGVTPEKYEAYGETIKGEPGVKGFVDNAVYGVTGYLIKEPLNVVPTAVAGGWWLAGGEVVGGGVEALAATRIPWVSSAAGVLTTPETGGIAGTVGRAVYNYGAPVALAGIGVWDITEGFTAPTYKIERNIGESVIPAAAMVGGGVGLYKIQTSEWANAIVPRGNYALGEYGSLSEISAMKLTKADIVKMEAAQERLKTMSADDPAYWKTVNAADPYTYQRIAYSKQIDVRGKEVEVERQRMAESNKWLEQTIKGYEDTAYKRESAKVGQEIQRSLATATPYYEASMPSMARFEDIPTKATYEALPVRTIDYSKPGTYTSWMQGVESQIDPINLMRAGTFFERAGPAIPERLTTSEKRMVASKMQRYTTNIETTNIGEISGFVSKIPSREVSVYKRPTLEENYPWVAARLKSPYARQMESLGYVPSRDIYGRTKYAEPETVRTREKQISSEYFLTGEVTKQRTSERQKEQERYSYPEVTKTRSPEQSLTRMLQREITFTPEITKTPERTATPDVTRTHQTWMDNLIGKPPSTPPPGSNTNVPPDIIPPIIKIPGIPSGSFGGTGAGGGGRISGFKFTESLGVRSAREVMFGSDAKRVSTKSRKKFW